MTLHMPLEQKLLVCLTNELPEEVLSGIKCLIRDNMVWQQLAETTLLGNKYNIVNKTMCR